MVYYKKHGKEGEKAGTVQLSGLFSQRHPPGFLGEHPSCQYCRTAKVEAGQATQAFGADSGSKYIYQANTAQLIEALKNRFIYACLLQKGGSRRCAIQEMIGEIAYAISPIRPNHSFSRNP